MRLLLLITIFLSSLCNSWAEDKLVIIQSISTSKKSFVIQYGEIEPNKIEEIELLIKAKEGKHLEMKYLTPSCGACTSFAPNSWSMNGDDGKADLKDAVQEGDMMVAEIDEDDVEANKQAADACPVQIIKVSGHNE